jgi:hypothetical protein
MASSAKQYVVTRVNQNVPFVGDPKAAPWPTAAAIKIDQFPWYQGGDKQATTVRLLYDDQAVYAQFICQDKHIYAAATELNGKVWEDSCVEFFGTIHPEKTPDYFNLEMNCCGTFLVGFNQGRDKGVRISPELAARVKVVSPLPKAPKAESAADNGWWIAVRLPFDVIAELSGQPVKVASGTTWRANFYRCGGKTDTQFGSWSPVDPVKHPIADFHRPEYFGTLVFG